MSDKPKLTIAMATYDDFDGCYFSTQALKLYHADMLDQIEILVIDNNPKGKHGNAVKGLLSEWSTPSKRKYVAFDKNHGTSQSRNMVFSEASGEYVLCMDSHVLLWPNSIKRLLEYYDANPDTQDMISGPIVYDNLHSYATHFDPVWRSEMWGIWSTAWKDNTGRLFCIRDFKSKGVQLCGFHDLMTGEKLDTLNGKPAPAIGFSAHQTALKKLGFIQMGEEVDDEPFEVPSQGLGMFSCKKSAWLGFNEHFRGFGGEECYIHEKFRQAGHKTMCLPFLRWNHRFNRPDGIKYPLDRHSKIRNYVLGHQELGLDLAPVYEHFVSGKKYSKFEWDKLVADPVGMVTTSAKAVVNDTGLCQPPREVMSLEDLYNWAETTPRDLNEHFDTLREYAERCDIIMEFTSQRESSICLLSSQPKHMTSYQTEADEFIVKLQEILPNQGFPVTWVCNVPNEPKYAEVLLDQASITKTEFLYLDAFQNKEKFLQKIEIFAPKVDKYIAIQGTVKYGATGIDGGEGLTEGIKEFILKNPEWFVAHYSIKQMGLVMLSRVQSERPDKVIQPWAPGYGCGTELKKMLSKIGIETTPTCKCNARATQMDFNGSDWCKDHKEDIMEWLKEESETREMPFVKSAASVMLAWAIRKGARAEKKVNEALGKQILALG